MNTRLHIFFCTVCLLLSIAAARWGWCFDYPKVELLLDKDYFPKVKALIDDAERSVHIMMFEASYYDKFPKSPSNQLIEAVANAGRRGLNVEVILEVGNNTERTTLRNRETGNTLKKNGVTVFLDSESITTHTKLLVIDKSIVVLGSTNWTYNALVKNHEISVVIHSENMARNLQDYFCRVKKSSKKL